MFFEIANFGQLIQIIAQIATAGSLYFTVWTFSQQRQVKESELIKDFNDKITALERHLKDIPTGDTEKLREWDDNIFNTIEHFAFSVNSGQVRLRRVIKTAADKRVIRYYEELFDVPEYKEDVKDKMVYTDFKLLYLKLKKKTSGRVWPFKA